jgi:hypothetical protein
MDFKNLDEKICKPKDEDFFQMFVVSKRNLGFLGKKSIG